jgi:hypothetical protein
MPLAQETQHLVSSAIEAGHTEEDFATLLIEHARRSGYDIVSEDLPVDDGLRTAG